MCDSIDSYITFIIPLAKGIIERRGGILVRGAIVAREYGISCVTGVSNTLKLISDGDKATFDGNIELLIIKNDF